MKTAKWICNPARTRRITGNPWGDRTAYFTLHAGKYLVRES